MRALSEPSWALGENALIVLCRSESEARTRVRTEYDQWAVLAARFCKPKALLKYPRCKGEGFPVLASEGSNKMMLVNGEMMAQVYLSPLLPASRPLMQTFQKMLEAERPMFLLSNETDDQLWLNQFAADMIQSSGADAVKRCMRNYWNGADLESLHQKLRDTSQPVLHTYRAILNDEQPDIWFEATSLYESVELGGKSFRLSVNQDFKILGRSDRLAPAAR